MTQLHLHRVISWRKHTNTPQKCPVTQKHQNTDRGWELCWRSHHCTWVETYMWWLSRISFVSVSILFFRKRVCICLCKIIIILVQNVHVFISCSNDSQLTSKKSKKWNVLHLSSVQMFKSLLCFGLWIHMTVASALFGLKEIKLTSCLWHTDLHNFYREKENW